MRTNERKTFGTRIPGAVDDSATNAERKTNKQKLYGFFFLKERKNPKCVVHTTYCASIEAVTDRQGLVSHVEIRAGSKAFRIGHWIVSLKREVVVTKHE